MDASLDVEVEFCRDVEPVIGFRNCHFGPPVLILILVKRDKQWSQFLGLVAMIAMPSDTHEVIGFALDKEGVVGFAVNRFCVRKMYGIESGRVD